MLEFKVIRKLSERNNESGYSINAHMEVLEDAQRQWTVKDVQSPELQQRFRPAGGKSSFGYTSSAYWVRVTLNNESSNDKWELSVINSLMDNIAIYPSKTLIAKNRLYPSYEINLPQGQKTTMYMRFETYGSMIIPLRLTSQSALYDRMSNELLFYGFYYGMLTVIAVFQIVLFLYTRNRAYLYYVLNVAVFCTVLLIWNGFMLMGLEGLDWSHDSINVDDSLGGTLPNTVVFKFKNDRTPRTVTITASSLTDPSVQFNYVFVVYNA